MKKKTFLFLLIILSSALLTGCAKKGEPTGTGVPTTIPTAVPTKPVEQTIKERPYVSLLSSSDGHWLTLEVKNIVKGTTGIEYELTYFADVEGNKLERGISTSGTPIELKGQTEYSKKLLLGSASCTTGTCKYKYDENVTEGTLILTVFASTGKESYSSAFRIQKGKEAKEGLSIGDGVFILTASSLPANTTYLTISSIGIPIQLPSDVTAKSIPYSVYPNLTVKGTVSFKTSVAGDIYALVGKTWQKLITKSENGKLSADFSNSSLFILGQ